MVLPRSFTNSRGDIMKNVTLGVAIVLAGLGLLMQLSNIPVDGSTTAGLLEAVPMDAVPRALLAELNEQSKNVMEGMSMTVNNPFGYATSTSSSTTASNNNNLQEQVSQGNYPIFDCAKLLQQLKTDLEVRALDPNMGRIYATRTRDTPPFYVALHNDTFDKTRWEIMRWKTYYEKALTRAFQEVLREAPAGARVLDVGGNIGFFSLVSASMGPFYIDTFEPNIKNRMRYCESLSLNRWTHTEFDHPAVLAQFNDQPRNNLYSYGVGEEEGIFMFQENPVNPGMGAVVNFKTGANNPNSLQIITLDNFAKDRGWFDYGPANNKPHIAILKVDVEGFEPSVIRGAKKLLQSGLVHNIFMEISARTEAEGKSNIPLLQQLSQHYTLHAVGGWMGPNVPVKWPNDDQLVKKILDATEKETAKQLNLWWKLPVKKVSTVQS